MVTHTERVVMPLVLDTSVLVAAVDRRDKHHPAAIGIMSRGLRREYGDLIATDHVLAEGLAYLRAKVRDHRVSQAYAALFFGAAGAHEAPLRLRSTALDVVEEATELHFEYLERGISLVDCTLIVHARRLGAPVATFNRGFQGLVGVVDR